MKRILALLAIGTLFLACLFTMSFRFEESDTKTCRLIVSVEELRNSKGLLNAIVYDRADGFPNSPENGIKVFSVKIEDHLREGRIELVAEDLPPGEYAISALHDENANGEMDFNFFKMPKEGYAFSNDPKITFGPPRYEDAKFRVAPGERTVRMKMQY